MRHCLAGDPASDLFGFHATTNIHAISHNLLHLTFVVTKSIQTNQINHKRN